MVEEFSSQYPVRELCLVLQVTRSGYYAWRRGPEPARAAANRLLSEEIRRVHRQNKGRYGSPRITEQLRREIQQLRKELARVTMQRDILKKTMGILSEP